MTRYLTLTLLCHQLIYGLLFICEVTTRDPVMNINSGAMVGFQFLSE